MKALIAILVSVFLGAVALAVEPDEMLADPALEARAEAIDQGLRCVVCQSQSIAESNAPLAKDMRLIVRERIVAGDSDKEVFDYLVARYGDYVLARPPVQANTLALWLFPAAILVAGLFSGLIYVRGVRKAAATAALSDDEADLIDRIVEERAAR